MNPDTTPTPRWVVNMSEDGHHYLWDDRKYDNYDLRTLCRILNEYEEKTNEVARLRNLLENMTESRDTMIEDRNLLDNEVERLREALKDIANMREYDQDDAHRLRYKAKMALFAPAPEEHSEKDTSTETCPSQKDTDWRELGPDEVICEGDQVMGWKKRDWTWSNVDKCHIGKPAHAFKNHKFHTLRPLSKHQKDLPMEKEIIHLQRLGILHYPEDQQALTDCLRYLRDEIQKLKSK